MRLISQGEKRQAAIAAALRNGLPLAGLLSALLVTTGCGPSKKSSSAERPEGAAAEVTQAATPERLDEPAVQPPPDRRAAGHEGPGSNAPATAKASETPWLTVGSPKLPVVRAFNGAALKSPHDEIDKMILEQFTIGSPKRPGHAAPVDNDHTKIIEQIKPRNVPGD